MAEAEVPEVQSYDVPSRLLGKDGRPAPHVTAEKYQTDYPQSIDNTDEFFGKVSQQSIPTQLSDRRFRTHHAPPCSHGALNRGAS
jgi:hypothetical protein